MESRGGRLQEQIDILLKSASSYVSFVQRKYEDLHYQYIRTVYSLIEYKKSLAERLDQDSELRRIDEQLKAVRSD